jgi:hypothetical protein
VEVDLVLQTTARDAELVGRVDVNVAPRQVTLRVRGQPEIGYGALDDVVTI